MSSKKLLYKVSANNAKQLYFNPKWTKSLKKRMSDMTDYFVSESMKIMYGDAQIKK